MFNGYVNQYKDHPIRVEPNQRIRAWVLDDGPSQSSSFHVIGTIFDTVYKGRRVPLAARARRRWLPSARSPGSAGWLRDLHPDRARQLPVRHAQVQRRIEGRARHLPSRRRTLGHEPLTGGACRPSERPISLTYGSGGGYRGRPRAARRTRARSPCRARAVALPTEHGGWALTLEPVVLGLLVAPSGAGVALGLAALVAFVARTPTKIVLVDRWRRRHLARTRVATRVAAVELVVLTALLVVAWSTATAPFWVPLACAVPLVTLEVWFDMRSRSRRLVPELAGTIGIGSVAAAIVLAHGDSPSIAAAAWTVVAARDRVGPLRSPAAPTSQTPPPPALGCRPDPARRVAFAALASVRGWLRRSRPSRSRRSSPPSSCSRVPHPRPRCWVPNRSCSVSPSCSSPRSDPRPMTQERRTMTSTIDRNATLATLVTQQPGLAREFERRALDYCCHGERTLADALCRPRPRCRPGRDRAGARRRIRPCPVGRPRAAELVDHLEATHHVYLHRELRGSRLWPTRSWACTGPPPGADRRAAHYAERRPTSSHTSRKRARAVPDDPRARRSRRATRLSTAAACATPSR